MESVEENAPGSVPEESRDGVGGEGDRGVKALSRRMDEVEIRGDGELRLDNNLGCGGDVGKTEECRELDVVSDGSDDAGGVLKLDNDVVGRSSDVGKMEQGWELEDEARGGLHAGDGSDGAGDILKLDDDVGHFGDLGKKTEESGEPEDESRGGLLASDGSDDSGDILKLEDDLEHNGDLGKTEHSGEPKDESRGGLQAGDMSDDSGGILKLDDDLEHNSGLVKIEESLKSKDEARGGLHAGDRIYDAGVAGLGAEEGVGTNLDAIRCEDNVGEPVSDGPEASTSTESEGLVQGEKAAGLTNFVKEKGVDAVSSFLRLIYRERCELGELPNDRKVGVSESLEDAKDDVTLEKPEQPIVMKGRVILYTRLGCQNCREARTFFRKKGLAYTEINIDVYPSRKRELEKFTGSSAVPMMFFNEVVLGGLNELKSLDESGALEDMIDHILTEVPPRRAPLPPLSGEDDASCSGSVDELAIIARKIKRSIPVKDRFYKMRWFTKCFLGSEAVDFLSTDQLLDREKAVQFGRKLSSKLFFRHVLEENLFEDGNHLYRFLDDDPVVSSQCYNIPRGIIEAKPKPISEIASRLRFLSYAILEAYISEDGRHVDYRSIHGSEEFARYLRIIQELQRVEIHDISREERLSFFLNLYNMMAIHAILVFCSPVRIFDRWKFFVDFKYVIGGCTYSLSALQNGILRGNQRAPFSLSKPFNVEDKRCQVALPYPEPLVHFALVHGSRSGPALRFYSPGNIDEELTEAARSFLRGGGFVVDLDTKVAYVTKILQWFSQDFGDNEVEALKHASIYLEPTYSEALLELLADSQLKVTYQPYDWELNRLEML